MNETFYTSIDRYGNNILYRGYNSDGTAIQEKVKFKPKLFVPDKNAKYDWKTMDGKSVKPIIFDSMKDMKQFVEMYSDVDNFEYYGFDRHQIAFIQKKFPGEIKFDSRLINKVCFDIETESEGSFPDSNNPEHQILTITASCSRDNSYHIWGRKPTYKAPAGVKYYYCEHEEELLQSFLEWINKPYYVPDILTGWNTDFFDVPYLCNRINKLLGEEAMRSISPWNLVSKRQVKMFGRPQDVFEISGIQQLDYMELFKKFGVQFGNQESYSLNHISHVVLGEKKLDYSDVGTLADLYRKDFQKFVDYNLKDVKLVDRLDEKLGYIDISLTLAYMGGVNYIDTLKTTPLWDAIIFRTLSRQKVVVPAAKKHIRGSFAGGYVKDPHVGKHEWVMSFDVNSLYPNIMVQYNMSPETLLPTIDNSVSVESVYKGEYVNPKSSECAVASNGARFRLDKVGIVPELVKETYAGRVRVKKQMIETQKKKERGEGDPDVLDREISIHNNKQFALKLAINSLYGALASPYFRYFDLRVAEGVTLTGQSIIQYAERTINDTIQKFQKEEEFKDRVCAIDTDSCYVNCSDLIQKYQPKDPAEFLNQFGIKVLEPALEKAFKEFGERNGRLEDRIVMGREVIADAGIWSAKKRYVLNVLDNEGVRYAKPKIKMMGIEAIKSSTPQVCREEMTRLFPIILASNESTVQSEIANFKEKFMKLPAQEIAFPRSVSDIRKYTDRSGGYIKGTPIHSRGSILYNREIRKLKLENKYHLIYDGDKIKFLYLKTPNPIHENIISFPDNHLPDELGLTPFLDYQTQFEKTFLDPIQAILTPIGWDAEPKASLDSFFA